MNMESFRKSIRQRVANDRDVVIIITGPEREGKSTLAFKLGKEFDSSFGPSRMVFDHTSFEATVAGISPGSVVVMDEAIEGGFSRDAMSKDNKTLAKFLAVCGERNAISFILFPNIKWLDSYITDHRAHFWILVERRGQALVHQRIRADYKGAKSRWRQVFRFTYGAEDGPDWDAYLDAKREMVQQRAGVGRVAFVPDANEVGRIAQIIRRNLG